MPSAEFKPRNCLAILFYQRRGKKEPAVIGGLFALGAKEKGRTMSPANMSTQDKNDDLQILYEAKQK
jgi:hypothetical protein